MGRATQDTRPFLAHSPSNLGDEQICIPPVSHARIPYGYLLYDQTGFNTNINAANKEAKENSEN